MIDESGLDTKLARLLHSQGKIGLDLLRVCLMETRAKRSQAGATLARVLVHKGVLSELEAKACLKRVAFATSSELRLPAPGDGKLASSFVESGPQRALEPPGVSGTNAGDTQAGETLVGKPDKSGTHDGATVQGRAWAKSGSHDGSTLAARAWAEIGGGQSDTLASKSTSGSGEVVLTWREGMRIGDYRILDTLGAGGMGIVYRVEQVHTRQLLAMKTLREDADPELVERLQREGEALIRVGAHPNVVGVHSLGSAYGRQYIILDLVNGGDLVGRMRGGPLPPAHAARVARDLAKGLDFLHQRGVLHRDLKPGNVLFDEHDTAKLVDFGLALVSRADRLTRSGEILGTPNFMAPEQALLDRERIGPGTDVYGLGGVLYYMLTGSTPFEGSSLVEIMTKVVKEPVKPPRSIKKETPAELNDLCMRALAKEPEDRPTAGAFLSALEAFLGGPPPPKPRSSSGLHAVLFALAALVLVAGGAVLGAVIVLRTQVATDPVVHPPLAAIDSTATSGARPVPPPQPPPVHRRESLGWRLAVGEVGSFTMTTKALITAKGERPMTLDYARTLGFAWRVQQVSGSAAELACTFDRLAVKFRTLVNGEPVSTAFGGSIDYDSTREKDVKSSPYQRAIGKTFSFVLDTTTGAVTSASGLPRIQAAIYADVRDERQQRRYRIADFETERAFEESLDPFLHLLPEGGEAPGWGWELRRELSKELSQQSRDPLPIVMLVEEKELPLSTELSWSGANASKTRERRIEGGAVFGPKGLRRSHQHDEIKSPEADIVMDVELVDPSR